MTKENPELDPQLSPELNAELEWLDGNIPVSTRFDDPYYSKIDGRAETRHVFIAGNLLEKKARENNNLVVAELGFGTGLNFIETWRWLEEEKKNGNIAPNTKLHFISFELYPISATQMNLALSHWNELEAQTRQLTENWHIDKPAFGFSPNPDIKLEVYFEDANARLPQLNFLANAWYLDGFTPSKNPELWGEALMKQVFDKTTKGGSIATYTVAGWVRRNLQGAGFSVEKIPGFAAKREMTIGTKPI